MPLALPSYFRHLNYLMNHIDMEISAFFFFKDKIYYFNNELFTSFKNLVKSISHQTTEI